MRVLLIVAGAANLAAGLWIALDPERLVDYVQVMEWSREWLRGQNAYAPPHSLADYPPNALVMLSPFAALGDAAGVRIWLVLNVAAAIAIAAAAPRRLAPALAAAPLLLLILPPFRTLNQFTLVSFALGLTGLLVSARAPSMGGVAIGLALFKPHIALPFALAAVVRRRWQTALAALMVVAVLFGVYLIRASQAPAPAIADYAAAIARTQNRADLPPGETNLAPILDSLPFTPVVKQATVLLLLIAGILAAARRVRDEETVLALACLASLLAFRHLGYNLVLAIPALLVAWRHASAGVRLAGWVCFAIFVASPPTLWRYLLEPGGVPGPVGLITAHAYRAATALLFVTIVAAGRQERPRAEATI